MKTVLVHGYAGETRMSIFRPPLDETGGFYGFRDAIDKQEATAFPWGIKKNLSFFEALNPISYVKIYRAEEKLTGSKETQSRLFEFLKETGATSVIGHSLGCRLIYETAKQLGLPPSVKRVVWVQAGVDARVSVSGLFPELINCWCPWDPTLFSSALFLHLQLRAGLVPIRGATNILVPLWRLPNLHTSSQKDSSLLKFVRSC